MKDSKYEETAESREKYVQELKKKQAKDLTMFNCKSDTILIADALSKFQKVYLETFGLDRLYCAFLPGYAYDFPFQESNQDVK